MHNQRSLRPSHFVCQLVHRQTACSTIERTNKRRRFPRMLWRARTGGTDNLGGFGVVTHRNITPGSSGSNFKAFHGSDPGFRPHPANQPKSVFRPKSSHQFISQLVTFKGVNANQVTHVFKPATGWAWGGLFWLSLHRSNADIVRTTRRPCIQDKRVLAATTIQVSSVTLRANRLQLQKEKLVSTCGHSRGRHWRHKTQRKRGSMSWPTFLAVWHRYWPANHNKDRQTAEQAHSFSTGGEVPRHLFSLGNNHAEHRRNMCNKTVQRSWGTRREHKA